MRVLVVIVAFVGACCVASASSESEIVKHMSERYDFTALTDFVRQIVRDHPTVKHVSLEKTKVGAKWRIEKVDPPRRMRSGDWVIWDKRDEEEIFELYYTFDETHSVTARVKRLARGKFELLGLSIEEWVSLR